MAPFLAKIFGNTRQKLALTVLIDSLSMITGYRSVGIVLRPDTGTYMLCNR